MIKNFSYSVYTNGACSSNPGPIGIGCVIYKGNGSEIVETISKRKGEGTNNEAEYLALIEGLSSVEKYNPKTVSIFSDSKLVINQINGVFAYRDERMKKMLKEVMEIKNRIDADIEFNWISRIKNEVADNLASTAINQNQGLIVKDTFITWEESFIDDINQNEIDKLPKTNNKCQDSIIKANIENTKMKFGDFLGLQTVGMDAYSVLGKDKLLECIKVRFGERTVDWLIASLEGTEYSFQLSALRWSARGLYPNLALKKASVDAEMKHKYESNKKTGS